MTQLATSTGAHLLGLLALVTVALCSCSVRTGADLAAAGNSGQQGTPVSELLLQLDGMAAPQGADAEQFADLKASLAAAIKALPGDRIVSAPPKGSPSAVKDLAVTVNPDQSATFTWRYTNLGDYNQDGEAGISDLTTVGQNIGKTTASPDWESARVADGNGDGEINISDITPLGQNFGARIGGYKLRYSTDPSNAAGWIELADVTVAQADFAGPFKFFTVEVPAAEMPTGTAYFQVVPYDGSELGGGSNVVTIGDVPPAIAGVTPLSVASGDSATFVAEVFGTAPLDYAWDFGGAASPSTSTAASPTVNMADSGGSFDASLTVSNPVGSDTFNFTIQLQSNTPPQAAIAASVESGPAPLEVVLNASGSSDSGGTIVRYQWDFDGDGTFDDDTGATPTVTHTYGPGDFVTTVRVTDDGGLSDEASVDIETSDAPPVADLQVELGSGAAPFFASFDASGSSSPAGKISTYELDWDGNGFVDHTSKDPNFRMQVDGPVGTYTATLTVTDSKGNTASDTGQVTITSVVFAEPAPESYTLVQGATPAETWLLSSYATLPEWRDGNGPYQSAYFADWANQLFNLINSKRAAVGLTPLIRDPHLDLVIQAHCRDEALRNYFDHTTFNQRLYIDDRIQAVQPPAVSWWGEVLGLGADDPQDQITGWMNSTGHKDQIMNPKYRRCGIGIYWKAGSERPQYWGADFTAYGEDPEGHDWLEPHEL